MKRLKIITDGTCDGTAFLDEDGNDVTALQCVQRLELQLDTSGDCHCALFLLPGSFELQFDGEVEEA
jgi:ferredoxin-thioredoxin reductase catalytic subunit